MSYGLSEYLTAQFYTWEQRGRGWHIFDQPVELESEFIPLFGHLPPERTAKLDDGRRPRFFPKLQESLRLFSRSESAGYGDEAFDLDRES